MAVSIAAMVVLPGVLFGVREGGKMQLALTGMVQQINLIKEGNALHARPANKDMCLGSIEEKGLKVIVTKMDYIRRTLRSVESMMVPNKMANERKLYRSSRRKINGNSSNRKYVALRSKDRDHFGKDASNNQNDNLGSEPSNGVKEKQGNKSPSVLICEGQRKNQIEHMAGIPVVAVPRVGSIEVVTIAKKTDEFNEHANLEKRKEESHE
ncbi:unnamed protein product [Ilex paraguariensis]|uniref:Uncharacterized protein n=1 Tax=Ilex paraguariensis TaxID=185542 RepID=A0ABC8SMI9_9AQUA